MKLSVTVNLGNYENIKIESGEYDNMSDCKTELSLALEDIHEPRVDDFLKRIFYRTDGGREIAQ